MKTGEKSTALDKAEKEMTYLVDQLASKVLMIEKSKAKEEKTEKEFSYLVELLKSKHNLASKSVKEIEYMVTLLTNQRSEISKLHK